MLEKEIASFLLKPFNKYGGKIWVEIVRIILHSLARIFRLLVPSGIIGIILFKDFLAYEDFNDFEIIFLLGLIPAVPLFLAELVFRIPEKSTDRVLDLHFKFILPLVLFIALAIVVLVTTIEFIVVDLVNFSERATSL